MHHATAHKFVQVLLQYPCTASKRHANQHSTGSTDPRSPCSRERISHSAFKCSCEACTFPQQSTEPDSAELASLVSPSDRPSVALNATDSRGPRHRGVPEASEDQDVQRARDTGLVVVAPVGHAAIDHRPDGRTRPLSKAPCAIELCSLDCLR